MAASYFEIIGIARDIRAKVLDALLALQEQQRPTAEKIQSYLKKDFQNLKTLWPARLKSKHLDDLARHIHFGQQQDYHDMLKHDIPAVEAQAEKHFRRKAKESKEDSLKGLMHPVIVESSYAQFQHGQWRDAVLNGVVAVFDLIRAKTGSQKDGAELIGEVFSLQPPKLILSEIQSVSGQNDQKGFLQIFQGVYLGIRNPKAHTLMHDLDKLKTSQYLVFLSLLARRVDEARPPQ